jgi:hypothetical protein
MTREVGSTTEFYRTAGEWAAITAEGLRKGNMKAHKGIRSVLKQGLKLLSKGKPKGKKGK